MFLVFWSVLDTISMDFFKQKFIETTRTDISNMLLSSSFKVIKKLILSCFVSSSILTFSSGCIEMCLVIWSVLDTISMIFSSKNSLKPLELTFLICYYHQVLNLWFQNKSFLFRLLFIKNNYHNWGYANYFQLQTIKKPVLSYVVV